MKFSPCATIHQDGRSPPIWEALSHADMRVLFPLLVFSRARSDAGLFGPVATQKPVQTHSVMLSIISGLHKQLLGWPFRKNQPMPSKNDMTNLILWKQYLLGLSSPGSFDMMQGEGWRWRGGEEQHNLLLGANFSYREEKVPDPFPFLLLVSFLKTKINKWRAKSYICAKLRRRQGREDFADSHRIMLCTG